MEVSPAFVILPSVRLIKDFNKARHIPESHRISKTKAQFITHMSCGSRCTAVSGWMDVVMS